MTRDNAADRMLESAFDAASCQAFARYWQSCRGGEGALMPTRSLLRPEGMCSLLPEIMILDIGDWPADVVIRLAGTSLVERWGFEPTGKPFIECMPGDQGERPVLALILAARHPCGVRMLRRVVRRMGGTYVVEVCFLPVWNDDRGVPQIFAMPSPLDATDSGDARTNPAAGAATLGLEFLDIGAGCPAWLDGLAGPVG